MGAKTKIDWADATWNPVTGCGHGCEYCYARKIAKRFYNQQILDAPPLGNKFCSCMKEGKPGPLDYIYTHSLHNPVILEKSGKICPYPFAFEPTFHRYKLDEPQKWKKEKNIFVCSMADLFGAWVPDEWITAVFDACSAAPQHRYLFLTKAPERFAELKKKGIVPPCGGWIGTSVTCDLDAYESYTSKVGQLVENFDIPAHLFVSIEPLLGRLSERSLNNIAMTDWVIIGAETGNRKSKVIPEKEWVMEIVKFCETYDTPIFMKDSLRKIMGSDFRQGFPW